MPGARKKARSATERGSPTTGAITAYETELWKMADALRGSMDAAEYKHVVLGLIFLKYISDAYEEIRARLEQDEWADPEDPDEYRAQNIFWVPPAARWEYFKRQARQPGIGRLVDDAMIAIERDNPALKDVLPKDYARQSLDQTRLGQIIDLVSNIRVGDEESRAKDVLGRVYEYFLSMFANAEGKRGGEFYTPRCVVKLLVEMIEPYEGRVYDPCCGSSGMFVQSIEFINAHRGGNGAGEAAARGSGPSAAARISIYGQESNPTTLRLAKMNLAIRGITGQIAHGDTFHNDRHPDLKADFILANPPFNVSAWGADRLREDQRWKYGVPPKGNANFAWVQHMVHHLAPSGVAGFVLANGSMSSQQIAERRIRNGLLEAELVDCMVALPGQLFYSTPIPACLWFLARDRGNGRFRVRLGEILFIDARKLGRMLDRTHRELTGQDIARVADTYHAWRGEGGSGDYEDIPGFCKSASLEEVRDSGYVLTPGRYVGVEPQEDDGEPFGEKMTRLAAQWREQRAEAARLDAEIEANLVALGFGTEDCDMEIVRRLRLGEDSRWEFKRIDFSGDRPTSPRRNDLADEIVAFANGDGGMLLCGVTDDGTVNGMSRDQLAALDRLLVEVSTNGIEPAVRIGVHHRELEGKAFLLVEVPKGDSLHESRGRSFIRVGASKRRLTGDERLHLAQRRGQGRHLWFDEQPLPDTGFATLDEALWKPLLSAEGAAEPVAALMKLAMLAADDAGVPRATVAGVLMCTRHPDQWLPNATIMATLYRGEDRTTGQIDSQEITGPLNEQIAAAVAFVMKNMRVAARKEPERVDMPQYSGKAVFEAVVNAVAHRDYAVRGGRIRLSMFSNRLEIQSPGPLPNNLTVESMEVRQATRNQAIESVMRRMPVGGIRGSEDRHYLMERRGDGVPVIKRETRELAGRPALYRVIDDSEVLLVIPAASQEASPARAVVTLRSAGRPLSGARVLVLFPNNTWKQAVTSGDGEAAIDLYATDLPMTVFAAAPGHAARLEREWIPRQGTLRLDLPTMPEGGSVMFPEATGSLPGLKGRLNPVRDVLDRTYLYATNIAINHGRPQPVTFVPGEELRLTDADGTDLLVRIVAVVGRSALVEYRAAGARP